MNTQQTMSIPNLGDFQNVTVIELLIQPGDAFTSEQSLMTVESDKASMEIPATQAGVMREWRIQLGDKVNSGDVMLVFETTQAESSTAQASQSQPPPPPPTPPTTPPSASHFIDDDATLSCDVVVLGGGPGGYSAAFRAADLGLKVVLVERYPTLGGVCLNVGCIPSKALLHVASVMDEAQHLTKMGVHFAPPQVDLAALRQHQKNVIGKLTGGLAFMAKGRGVTVLQGVGVFADPYHLEVSTSDGLRCIRFQRCIIAVGSQPIHLPFFPQDDRIVDSTGALQLPHIPKRLLIVGGGIIGLEMGTVYATLGTRLDVVEMQSQLMPGADADLVKVWQKYNQHRFDHIRLNTKTVAAEATSDGVVVTFESQGVTQQGCYDMVLQAVGRTPNGGRIQAERAQLEVDARGFITVDRQMRTHVPHLFAIGDVVGQPMLAHKAVHQAHVAAEVIAGELQGLDQWAKSSFDARVIPSVAYTDPEIAWVGLTETEAKAQSLTVTKGLFPWSASGRAIANGRDEGHTKLLFDAATGRIVGGGMVGTHAGDMIGEVALAIEMGADAIDLGKTIHPHPTLGETLGLAAEAALGHCTDLPRKR